MSRNLLILGSSGFVGRSILRHISENSKIYKKKISSLTLVSRRNNSVEIIEKLKKSFKIYLLKKNFFNIGKLPKSEFIIYALLQKNYKQEIKSINHFIKILNKEISCNIIFTSSGAVYGDKIYKRNKLKESSKINTNYNFSSPQKVEYARSKIAIEQILKNFSNNSNKISILRCFAFVGVDLPRNKKFVIGNFIDNIFKLKKIFVKSEYKIFRSYMHQDEMSRWILKILFNIKNSYSIYNVGSDDAISIHNLALKLSQKYRLPFQSNFSKETNLIENYIPNTKLAQKKFNLKLNYNTLQAINKTIIEIKKTDYKI